MALLFAAVLSASPLPVCAQADERAREILDDPSFQTELPVAGSGSSTGGETFQWPPAPRGGEDEDTPSEESSRDTVTSSAGIPLGASGGVSALGTVLQAFFWAAVAVVVVVLLATWIRNETERRRSRFRLEDGDAGDLLAGRTRNGGSRDELDGLLSKGRYGEAVHLLLVLSFQVLDKRSDQAIPKSFTSREVLRRRDLAPEQRGGLSTLVAAVEKSLFGGMPVTRDDYDRCAAAFDAVSGAAP